MHMGIANTLQLVHVVKKTQNQVCYMSGLKGIKQELTACMFIIIYFEFESG